MKAIAAFEQADITDAVSVLDDEQQSAGYFGEDTQETWEIKGRRNETKRKAV
jgi:hypothetical protein